MSQKLRRNKSVSFSEATASDKSGEVSEGSVNYGKKQKRGKFEKPSETKKCEKKKKNLTKRSIVAKSDEDEGKKGKKAAAGGEKTEGPPNKFDRPKSFVKKGKTDARKSLVTSAEGKKPDWLEFKKEKKELKETRRAKRLTVVYEASVKAKLVGEKLRRADCAAHDRVKLTNKLYELLKGNLNKAIFTHDMSRVVQWLIKYSSPEIRQSVLAELKPSFVAMFQSKYAKNCLKKAFKHGSDEMRNEIISSCYGNVVKLVSHGVSSPLLDYAYTTFATDLNKIHFKQEFYGDMYKQAKDDSVKTISDVFESASDMKSATLSAVKINLIRVVNKKLVTSPIVQAVLLDYLGICSPEDRSEFIVMLRSSIVELSKSEDGTKIAMTCIWHGTNKDRKLSLKAIKQQAKNIAQSEHGHAILMAMFDCVDDTVLMKKLLLPEILSDLAEIASNEYGRRVILYLVARRDPHHFHPALVEHLKQGDANATSKKTADIREKELIEAIIEPFLKAIAEDATSWLANGSIAMVTLAILKKGHGDDLKRAFESIARFITNPESKLKEEDGAERDAAEHSGLHVMLKKLIQADGSFAERQATTFGQVLVEFLNEETIERWIGFNRGCYLLIILAENAVESVVASLLPKIKCLTHALKSKKGSGASILLKKIQ